MIANLGEVSRTTKPCQVPLGLDKDGDPDLDGPLCSYHRKPGKVKCEWHWLLSQPIEVQVRAAEARERTPHFHQPRPTVPKKEWPEGERWCAGCQTFVPLFYVQGSRCRACASRANHASHVRRTYGLDPAEYQALLEWQGGRCFICGQVPRSRRLAVDHDHETGEVRGVLCFTCNVGLGNFRDRPDLLDRAVHYLEDTFYDDRLRLLEEPA